MAILKNIIILSVSFLCTACYQDFTPEVAPVPVLCINSLITADEPIDVKVSHTWVFNDTAAEADHSVADAAVYIYANGKPQEIGYIPQEGDVIRIVAESATYGIAEAEVKVPEAAKISLTDVDTDILDLWKHPDAAMMEGTSFNLRVALSVADSPAHDNYYKLGYYSVNPAGDDVEETQEETGESHTLFYPGMLDYDAEPIFREHIGAFESIMGVDDDSFVLFSDRQFPGKSYTLHLHFNNAYYRVNYPVYAPELYDCKIVFYIATVSESYYNRAIYVWQRDSGTIGDLGDLGFAEPIWGYSNVSTGAGVVAARAYTTCVLDLKDFLQTTLNGK